jgi:hypothetical protein
MSSLAAPGGDAGITSQRIFARKQRVAEALSTTPRRVLAVFAALGTITGAIAGVIALLPKSPETLAASVEALSARPEVSLEEYDVRAGSPIDGTAHASTGVRTISYRLAADTATSLTTTTAAQPEAQHAAEGLAGGERARKPSRPSSQSSHGTSTNRPEATTPAGGESKETSTGDTSLRAKRTGGKLTLEPLGGSYPKEVPEASPGGRDADRHEAPAAESQRKVEGAVVSEGEGKKAVAITTVAGLVASGKAGEAPVPEAAAARIVLPRSCQTGSCGATQEIERALTYDPNPVKAAQAVAAVFKNSRSEIVGKRLYPLGAMVSYMVSLQGFAHKRATLQWSLTGGARKHPLPRPWWHDVVAAQIEPTVNDETISGSFWVPMPPARGSYEVHLSVLDDRGIQHGERDTAPFH